MKVLCSSNMPFAREAFSTLGDVTVLDGRAITAQDVRDAEILAIRSTTRVDAELLAGSAVRFVGTATIGTDHMDIDYLDNAGIRWCYSPGCNANSVSEYITAALLCLAGRHGFTLAGKTIGAIGVGKVGSLVVEKATALGMRVLPNDPPRQRAEGGTSLADRVSAAHDEGAGQGSALPINHQPLTINHSSFVSLDQVLAEADVISLHVPLTREGRDATYHLANEPCFERMKPGTVFLNASRGAVVDTDALLAAMDRGRVAHAVIDTWEGEPNYRTDLLKRVDLGTTHIAGHSFEGKYVGTLMVYREACKFLRKPPTWTPDSLLPPPVVSEVAVEATEDEEEAVLRHIVKQVYDIEADDQRMRASAMKGPEERTIDFDTLRKDYPMRREFRFTRVNLQNASARLRKKTADLGFMIGP